MGDYTYDAKTEGLIDTWSIFPSGANYPEPNWGNPMGPIPNITKADVRNKLAYAHTRGFRTLLYFSDGLVTCTGARNFKLEETVPISDNVWSGPDTKGISYMQNPLHPGVRDR